ncbi:hypothetical protein BaRGS_00010282 [Batillaria attramentaria]|uniref:Uncharacterized protein n=1 Tax=Batillaria attramentaria TaxID=370345 RepID=A0ABD0LH00_9CAEN
MGGGVKEAADDVGNCTGTCSMFWREKSVGPRAQLDTGILGIKFLSSVDRFRIPLFPVHSATECKFGCFAGNDFVDARLLGSKIKREAHISWARFRRSVSGHVDFLSLQGSERSGVQ